MKQLIISAILVAFASPVLADKPAWAGSGKPPTAEQKEAHKQAMRAKRGKSAGEHDDADYSGDSAAPQTPSEVLEDLIVDSIPGGREAVDAVEAATAGTAATDSAATASQKKKGKKEK